MSDTSVEPSTLDDHAFAVWAAEQAGEVLLRVRGEGLEGRELKDAGDRAAQELLARVLAEHRPDDAVLSEEAADDKARLSAKRVWIIDPLDGTREFSEEGRSDWAVHVALWARTAATPHGLVAGAVGLPAQHRVLGTDYPPAYPPMTVEAATAPGGRTIRLAASRSRPPVFLTDLAEDVGAHLVPMGSAGAKIAAVVTGEVDAYIHAGGQYEWDSAAPVAVATATGLHASRIDGSGLKYNEADPRLPDLLVCRKDLASRLLAALRRHSG